MAISVHISENNTKIVVYRIHCIIHQLPEYGKNAREETDLQQSPAESRGGPNWARNWTWSMPSRKNDGTVFTDDNQSDGMSTHRRGLLYAWLSARSEHVSAHRLHSRAADNACRGRRIAASGDDQAFPVIPAGFKKSFGSSPSLCLLCVFHSFVHRVYIHSIFPSSFTLFLSCIHLYNIIHSLRFPMNNAHCFQSAA